MSLHKSKPMSAPRWHELVPRVWEKNTGMVISQTDYFRMGCSPWGSEDTVKNDARELVCVSVGEGTLLQSGIQTETTSSVCTRQHDREGQCIQYHTATARSISSVLPLLLHLSYCGHFVFLRLICVGCKRKLSHRLTAKNMSSKCFPILSVYELLQYYVCAHTHTSTHPSLLLRSQGKAQLI